MVGRLAPVGFDDPRGKHLATISHFAADAGTVLGIHLHGDASLGSQKWRRIARLIATCGRDGRAAISSDLAHESAQAGLLKLFASAGVALVSAADCSVPVPPLRALRDPTTLDLSAELHAPSPVNPFGTEEQGWIFAAGSSAAPGRPC